MSTPAFSSPTDCTPWVIGGLWPAELSTVTDETATLAEYLRTDLQRITTSANHELKIVKRAGLADAARHAAETRVIDDARARAERRVESTIRQLDMMKAQIRARRHSAQVAARFRIDIEKTQVIPAVPAVEPEFDEAALDKTQIIPAVPAAAPDITEPTIDQTQVIPVVRAAEPVADEPVVASEEPAAGVSDDVDVDDDDDEAAEGRHRAPAESDLAVVTSSPEPEPEPESAPDADEAAAIAAEPAAEVSDDDDDDAVAADGRHRVAREHDVAVVADTPPEPEVEEAAAPVAAESDTERLSSASR